MFNYTDKFLGYKEISTLKVSSAYTIEPRKDMRFLFKTHLTLRKFHILKRDVPEIQRFII